MVVWAVRVARPIASHSPLLQVGVLRLLLPLRKQCCYGDHCYLATELHHPGHLLSLWLWGWTCVQKPPRLRTPTLGDKPGRPGRRGRAESLLGLRESEVEPSHTKLSFFSKLGITVFIYGIIKMTW